MRLRAIRLRNVRRFTEPVALTGIGPGLNVLSAPNEQGKSTFFDALHALFFKDRKSWDKEIRGLVPHAGGDPEVSADVEIGGKIYSIEKRWARNRKGDARITTGGDLFKQADEAEAWLKDVLADPKDGGPAGLLWVSQGMTGLDDGETGRTARRNLLSSVTGEVEAMTGGRHMDEALRRCREALDRYVTGTGKARKGGPLDEAEQAVAELETLSGELSVKVKSLEEQLTRRKDARRDLADLEDPARSAEREERLSEAQATHDAALRHAEALDRAAQAERTAQADLERTEEQLKALEARIREVLEAKDALAHAQVKTVDAEERKQQTETAHAGAKEEHEAARTRWTTADGILKKVEQAKAAFLAEERRRELSRWITEAEKLRTDIETAKAEAGQGLAPKDLNHLEALDREVRVLSLARDNEAAALSMAYAPGQSGRVTWNAHPLTEGARIAIPEGASLDIEGIGRLTVHPGQGTDDGALTKAQEDLHQALTTLGQTSMDAARAATDRHGEAISRQKDAQARLSAIAPDGLGALRAKLSELPDPVEDDPHLPDLETAADTARSAKEQFERTALALEQVGTALAQHRETLAEAKATLDQARLRTERALAASGELAQAEARKAQLSTDLQGARDRAVEAKTQKETLAEAAPDLEAAKAALERARSVRDNAQTERQRLREDLIKLDAEIQFHANAAVQEEHADALDRLAQAQRRADDLRFEVSVLTRLRDALEQARGAARDRYVEPVLQELAPLIRLLWPEAEIRFDADTVMPEKLVRAGTDEDFTILSGGTQEQLALLVRLAFARILAKSGHPAPVILDDAIVYTDDVRIERMFDALTRQAQDLQIIVFSCRQKAFRDLGGQTLKIERTGEGSRTAH